MSSSSVPPYASVTFMNYVKTNKHTFKIFSPSGSQAILVFPHQTSWQYSDGNHANGGVECRWVGRRRDYEPISGSIACCQRCDHQVLSTRHRRSTVPQVVTLIAGSKWWSLLTAGDDDEMFMTRSLNVTPKTTEQQHVIACNDKSVSYVSNNKRLCSTFCY